MNAKQMVETIHEHFPQKGGLRVLRDLNAELRRYAEDVRPWHQTISFFEQELVTESGEPIVTHAGETLHAEQYGSSFPLPFNVFIVRDQRTAGEFYADVNGRTVTLFQDRYYTNLFELTDDNEADCELTLDCVVYPQELTYSNEDVLGSHSEAILAGVLSKYYGATGRFNEMGFWKKEAKDLRREAKAASTTDGSYKFVSTGLLTPPKDRR